MKKIAKILSLTILMCIFTASFNLCAVSAATAVYCSVCGEKITDCEYYDDDGNPLCDDVLYNEEGEVVCENCYENTEIEFDEDLSVYVSYETDGYEANVTITASIEDAIIYYTLDGEDPTDKSDVYNDVIVLYEDTTVKAFAQYGDLETEIAEIFIPVEEVVYDTECPKCGKFIKINDDICDDDGYAICPYCNEYVIYDTDIIFNLITSGTSKWATEEVCEAHDNNLIPYEMYISSRFDGYICRAEFAAVAVKLYERIVGEVAYADIADTPFNDCYYNTTYNSYIATAYKLGITNGTTNTEFEPTHDISREDIATMLCRVIKLAENDKLSNFDINSVTKFHDDSYISDYARQSVYFMAKHEIIKGFTDKDYRRGTYFTLFKPSEDAKIEEALVMSLRCFKTLFWGLIRTKNAQTVKNVFA